MKEVRYFYVPEVETSDALPDEEAQHAIRVLRLDVGDIIFLMDGKGCFHQAEITFISNHKCQYRILETMPQEKTWNGRLCVAMAPTKMLERTEWFVEKATEIGVDEFAFLNCKFSERRVLKLPRIEKICVSAVKQSRKAWIPLMHEMDDFRDFVTTPRSGRKFIAHCYNEFEKQDLFAMLTQPCPDINHDCTVLIGPEGDFSVDEVKLAIDNGWVSVSLGESRLRTETAAIVAAEMMQIARRKQ